MTHTREGTFVQLNEGDKEGTFMTHTREGTFVHFNEGDKEVTFVLQ